MTEFALTRKQVLLLADLATKFPETNWFTLDESHGSGIGPTVTVKFTIFNHATDFDTTVNITDVDIW